MRVTEILNEFAPPQEGSDLADLIYLLQNAPISYHLLAKGLEVIRHDKKIQQQKTARPVQQPVQQQPVQQQPVQQLVQEPEEEPELVERAATPPKKSKANTSLIQQIQAELPGASEQTLKRVLYNMKLDSYHTMADEIITKKISVKVKAIKSAIKLALTDLADTVSVETMVNFLKECDAGGVIDTRTMVNQTTVNSEPIPLTNDDYRPIVLRLMQTGLGSAAASGKGEFGLAFAGIGASKGQHDITINNVDIEVKASHGGTDFFFKGQTGFGVEGKFGGGPKEGLSKLVDALNSVGGNFQKINEVGKGGISQINDKTLKALNPYFQLLGKNDVENLLCSIIQDTHPDHSIKSFFPTIKQAVRKDGSVSYQVLSVATSAISFFYYQKHEKHTGILMLNITNGTYMYQNNPKEFMQSVAAGAVSTTSAIDFRTSTKGSLTFRLN
jgi:hypothetical protein